MNFNFTTQDPYRASLFRPNPELPIFFRGVRIVNEMSNPTGVKWARPYVVVNNLML